MKKLIKTILPHAAIIISGMYFVFFFIDKVNSAMAFINNNITKALLFVLCVISIINACIIISGNRREVREAQKRARERRRAGGERYAQDDTRAARYTETGTSRYADQNYSAAPRHSSGSYDRQSSSRSTGSVSGRTYRY